MCRSRLLIFVVLFVVAFAHSALADPDDGNVFAHQLLGVPVYDPGSKRYFAFMQVESCQFCSVWNKASEAASKRSFKGVRGRLAIVDSLEVHEFLLKTFHPNHYQYVWIGLRYLCRARKLEWSDGTSLKPGSFQFWDKQWNQDVYTCSDKNDPNDWAPVAYTPSMHSWIVKGRHKGYDWYFMEYPTGHE